MDHETTNKSLSKLRQVVGLVVSLLIVFRIPAFGGFLANLSVGRWYLFLNKPSWTPTGAAIGTIWKDPLYLNGDRRLDRLAERF
ncbi:MAG: tryptophan-rich sensory protein [Desulfomonilaceae bacterium]